MSKELVFTQSKTEKDIQDIYNFNVQAFTDTQDFDWSVDSIKKEIKEGWKLYSVNFEEDIVAALFMKKKGDALYTKNTPIKLTYQGNGFSHQIKDFYEAQARDASLKKVYNYCPFDNFRMIALNEGHDYFRTGNTLGGNDRILEWEKRLD